MVDALRRAHRLVTPTGVVVDLHPTAERAAVGVAGHTLGHVQANGAPERHAAADAAVRTAVDDGLFDVERAVDFDFYTYGDSIEELRDHIVENWRDAQIDDDVVQRTRRALAM